MKSAPHRILIIYAYNSPLTVVMLHINTKTNPNPYPYLIGNCAVINKQKKNMIWCIFQVDLQLQHRTIHQVLF